MKQVIMYADVPPALVDLVRKIRFESISQEQGTAFLTQLNMLADQYSIPRRTAQSTTRWVDVPEAMPQVAVDAINGRDFSQVSSIMIGMAMPIIKKRLTSMGLM